MVRYWAHLKTWTLFTVILGVLGCQDRPFSEPPATTTYSTPKIFEFEQVSAAADFSGARLSNLIKHNDTTFEAHINPENVPINNSPWYCFQIWSEVSKHITLKFKYPNDYQHRYIPKFSHDGRSWQPFDSSSYYLDGDDNFNLNIPLTTSKLWISAQENLNLEYLDQWMQDLSTNENVRLSEVGSSAEGRPIKLLTISQATNKYNLVLIGRQHPPEVPGGTIALKAFVRELIGDSPLANNFRSRFQILLFPLLNPDGVQHGHWRHNAAGKDLNRDWVDFTQPETRVVRDHLLAQDSLPNAFGIDFHTSFSGPYLLTLDSVAPILQPTITQAWIQAIGQQTTDSLDIRPRAQSLPYCYNWFINTLEMEAVTYEEGDEIDRMVIQTRAQLYAQTLMHELLGHFQ